MKNVDYFILGHSFNSLGIAKKIFERGKTFQICGLREVEIRDYFTIDNIFNLEWNFGQDFLTYYHQNSFPINSNFILPDCYNLIISKDNNLFVIKYDDQVEKISSKKIIYSPSGMPALIENNFTNNNQQLDANVEGYFFKNKNVLIIGSGYNMYKQLEAANLYDNYVSILNPKPTFSIPAKYLDKFNRELTKVRKVYLGAKIISIKDIIDNFEVTVKFEYNEKIIFDTYQALYNGMDFKFKNIEEFQRQSLGL